MRRSVPLASAMIQTLPAPVATDPSELPMVVFIVALTVPVFRSICDSVWSPQFGTHRLPNPVASPEHGRLPDPRSMVAATLLDLGSNRETESFGLFETHADSSMANQSGLPPTSKTASGLRRSMGIFTPGAFTPGRGGGAWFWPSRTVPCSAQPMRTAWSVTVLYMSFVHNNHSCSSATA